MHFIESLAVWLSIFETDERMTAYSFVKDRLIFVSEAEMQHLVSLSYPDKIRKVLISRVADNIGLPEYDTTRITSSKEFKKAERKSLFLGLSDGARVDVFRRKAGLNNEQVYATYQLSDEKAKDMVHKLRDDLNQLESDTAEERFDTLFLFDDFSGSGDSLLREEENELNGKLFRCITTLVEKNAETQLLDLRSLSIHVVLYICTSNAKDTLDRANQREVAELPPPVLALAGVRAG